ncbi:hypothetical protein Sfulv_53020 [Streptomyces fulvorobeus]|uniref:VOC domain-containing protein n=1 Tax=Streptomyces fulvorobeus TaxID=284028 RepID=A0A7J0CD97_9ACTN|nr:hypothetical protein Sfulv_53020 [Streptomyces fulvorobeus]
MRNPSFATGVPNWIDLGTPDLDGATAFYRGLFGWELVPGGPETGEYGMYSLDGNAAAGVMTVPEERAKPSWSVYFQSPDAYATATTVTRAGGSVLFEPMDVREFGRMAGFTDNEGRTSVSGSRGPIPAWVSSRSRVPWSGRSCTPRTCRWPPPSSRPSSAGRPTR